MEETKSLLMMVLQKVFHHRPHIVEDTFQLIYNFNNSKQEKKEYENTLKTICDLMNGELSSEVLVYLLTMVDMPKDGFHTPIMEIMQKTHEHLAETVRPHLLECLKNKKVLNNNVCTQNTKQQSVENKKPKNKTAENTSTLSNTANILLDSESDNTKKNRNIDRTSPKKNISTEDDCFLKPAKRPRKMNRDKKKTSQLSDAGAKDPNDSFTLTNICANFCVNNETFLKKMYKTKLDKAWLAVNTSQFDEENVKKQYAVIRYLNRMLKLVRMVENTEVTTGLLSEEYTDTDIFIREKHMQDYFKWDPFEEM